MTAVPQYLTAKAAAKLIDRDTSRIYRWISEGKLPKHSVNGLVCVELSELLSAELATRGNINENLRKAREKKKSSI